MKGVGETHRPFGSARLMDANQPVFFEIGEKCGPTRFLQNDETAGISLTRRV